MEWPEALESEVARTKNERLRELCGETHPDHVVHRQRVLAKAINGPKALAYPSLLEQAGNAIGALGRVAGAAIQGKPVLVDIDEKNRRLAICDTCEFFDHARERCSKCGCPAKLKVALATEIGHCPIGLW
jgi:hypothetical protein